MVAGILAIISALLPLLFDWLEERQKGKPYAEKQTIRRAAVTGDVDTLSAQLDRMRELIARRSAGK
jgi:hypothetical protein